jgi:hypothetical protein
VAESCDPVSPGATAPRARRARRGARTMVRRIDFPSMRARRLSSLRRRVRCLHCARHLRCGKRSSRWLARFGGQCELESLVTTFYPCRHVMPNTRCCMRPKRARRIGFGRSAPSIRTAARNARPWKITGASTNLQRGMLLLLTTLRAQISEAMSLAPWGITPSSR